MKMLFDTGYTKIKSKQIWTPYGEPYEPYGGHHHCPMRCPYCQSRLVTCPDCGQRYCPSCGNHGGIMPIWKGDCKNFSYHHNVPIMV